MLAALLAVFGVQIALAALAFGTVLLERAVDSPGHAIRRQRRSRAPEQRVDVPVAA